MKVPYHEFITTLLIITYITYMQEAHTVLTWTLAFNDIDNSHGCLWCIHILAAHLNSIPLRPLLTGPISNWDIKLCWAEILEKLNVTELTIKYDIAALDETEGIIVRVNSVGVISLPRVRVKPHCRNIPVMLVVHINSSWPPQHTGATPEGEIVMCVKLRQV